MRLVYYSLACSNGSRREDQLITSVRTLRQHNRSMPVLLFLYGTLTRATDQALKEFGVQVRRLGEYGALLRRLCPRIWQPLSLYPVLHKWLSLSLLPHTGISQLLYIDCDTFFMGDVRTLFDRYSLHDWYAREEPCTARSPWGPIPGYVNERSLSRLATAQGATVVPPYNLGVCMMNNGVWQTIAGLQPIFLSLVWRLLVGVSRDSARASRLSPNLRRGLMYTVTRQDLTTALPYPSSNTWIVEEIAMLLVLGMIPGFQHAMFSRRDVVQGNEFERRGPSAIRPTVCHYFSNNQERFTSWLAQLG